MEIQAVGAPASLMPLAPERSLSKTTLKTHALVVLSYLLIGIGIALACASVYMATMMSPMLAMATPVAPIALGILLKPGETSGGIFSTSKAPVYIKGQPLGFRNEDGSTCWLNSAMQVLFGSSSGKGLMGNLSITNFSLFPLRSAFRRNQAELLEEGGRPISSVSSAKVREWLSGLLPSIPKSNTQEDPMDFLNLVFSKTGYHLPLMEQPKGKNAKPCTNTSTIMLFPEYGKKQPFSTLLNGFFDGEEKKWFTEAPKGFIVGAYRTAPDEGQSVKGTDSIAFPKNLELTKAQCREGSRKYSPDAFILHLGAGTESGHYMAYIHRNGYWWKANDEKITQVTDGEAETRIQAASIVHYAQN